MNNVSSPNFISLFNKAKEKTNSCPNLPSNHFHPPAQWMNDPNGTFYKDGYYYIFYQYNPFSDSWDHMHWGATRTKNFITWEYLPIALKPQFQWQEQHCFSGGIAFNNKNEPLLFYTSVSFEEEGKAIEKTLQDPMFRFMQDVPSQERKNVQRIATSKDLIHWDQREDPVLSTDTPKTPYNIRGDWRDPFIFQKNDISYLSIGATTDEGEPLVLLYTNTDDSCINWEYRTTLMHFDNADFTLFECPNFFQWQGYWLLIGSPYQPVIYYQGDFNEDTLQFLPQDQNLRYIDYSSEFYATNILFDQNRCLLIGWMRGFPKGLGWNGCLATIRELYFTESGQLYQLPIEEYRQNLGKQNTILLNNSFLKEKISGKEWTIPLTNNDSDQELNILIGENSVFNLRMNAHKIEVNGTQIEPEYSLVNEIKLICDNSSIEIMGFGGTLWHTSIVLDLYQADKISIKGKPVQISYRDIHPYSYEDKT